MVAALLLVVAASLLLTTNAVIVSSCSDKDMKTRACIGQPEGIAMCNACDQTFASYLVCTKGTGVITSCPKNNLFDYALRACVKKDKNKIIMTCQNMNCPGAIPFAGMSAVVGTFGKPGNWTYVLPKTAGQITVFSPVPLQCAMGLTMAIISRGRAPDRLKWKPVVTQVNWTAPLKNSMVGFTTLPEYRGYTGDTVIISWDEPNHLLAWSSESDKTRRIYPVINYPPQPVYKCPEFKPFANSDKQVAIANETIFAPIAFQGNRTYNFTTVGDRFFADPMPASCRLGLVFKASVKASTAGYKPVNTVIAWGNITYDNQPDRSFTVGDTVTFIWSQPNAKDVTAPPHGVSVLDPILVKRFIK